MRDVVLLIVADEEAGGRYGAEWLLGERPDLLRAHLVLGEGAYSVRGWNGKNDLLHAIAVAEKGYLEVELHCAGMSQHASMPDGVGAAARLTNALTRIVNQKSRVKLTAPTRVLLQHLGARKGGVAGWLLQHSAIFAMFGLLDRDHGPLLNSMLRDTVALTILEAGSKSNVLSGSARAVLSIRLLPGTDPDGLIESIQRASRDPTIKMRRLKDKKPTASSFDTPEYELLARMACADGGTAVPILSPGASDCRFWRAAGVPCYGWVPFAIGASDLHSVHGANERVSIEEFGAGIRRLFQAVVALEASEVQHSTTTLRADNFRHANHFEL